MKLLGYSDEDAIFPTEGEMITTLNSNELQESSETANNNGSMEDHYNPDLKFQEPYEIVWYVGQDRQRFVGITCFNHSKLRCQYPRLG